VTLAIIAAIGFGLQVIAWLVGPEEREAPAAGETIPEGPLAG
jgi:hypothetical protein